MKTPTSRQKWDQKWRNKTPGGDPAPWLRALDEPLVRRGRALDVAGGDGRNAAWLLARGLTVTLCDISGVALQRARERCGPQLITLQVDLESEPLPEGPFDLILVSNYLQRDLFPSLRACLRSGGQLVFVQATLRNLERHAHPAKPWLLAEGEAPALVGLPILRYDEGWTESGRHEARVLAQRPRPALEVESA